MIKSLIGLVLIIATTNAAANDLVFSEICKEHYSFVASSALKTLKSDAISNVIVNGRSVQDEGELFGHSMQDIRVKFRYYEELAKARTNAAEVENLFFLKKNQLGRIVGLKAKNNEVREKMIAQIENSQIIPFEKFLEKDIDEMSFYFTGWKNRGNHLEMNCQKDGLLLSAFYYKPDNTVILCPGSELRIATGEITPDSLEFLLAHEVSHSVDTRSFPEEYEFLKKQYNISEEFHNESAADYWAAQMINPKSTKHLKDNLRYFCDSPETSGGFANYLSGNDRVKFILDLIFDPASSIVKIN